MYFTYLFIAYLPLLEYLDRYRLNDNLLNEWNKWIRYKKADKENNCWIALLTVETRHSYEILENVTENEN